MSHLISGMNSHSQKLAENKKTGPRLRNQILFVINFQPKHVLWLVKRTVSMRW